MTSLVIDKQNYTYTINKIENELASANSLLGDHVLTISKLKQFSDRLITIWQNIAILEYRYLPAITKSNQLLAMDGNFNQQKADALNAEAIRLRIDDETDAIVTPAAELREWLLASASSAEVNIPEMKQRVQELMEYVEYELSQQPPQQAIQKRERSLLRNSVRILFAAAAVLAAMRYLG